jgi:DNA polymerase-3 subunit beta
MNITIERAALQKALARLAGVVERRNTIPILANLLLHAEGNRLRLTATNLDIEAVTECPAETGLEPSATTVPALMLTDIVRRLAADQVEMAVDADGRQMTIRGGRARFTINILPASDWPAMAAGDLPCRFTLAAEDFGRMLSRTAFAMSSDETRYYLQGVYLHRAIAGPAELVAVATDGHRLSKAVMALPAGAEAMPGVIIPQKTVETIRKRCEDGGDVTVELSPQKIRVSSGGTVILSKLIDGTFPDYLRVIPQNNDKRAGLVRAALEAAAQRVAAVTGERGKAVKLAFADGAGLTLTCRNADAGEAEETIDAEWASGPFEIGFNARYLADLCGVLPAEQVDLTMADPGSPALFSIAGDPSLLIVLMPMRA